MLGNQTARLNTVRSNRRYVAFQVSAAKGFGTKVKAPPKPQKDQPAPETCPCASGKVYKNCCGPIHRGDSVAPTPEATLRARFSAFIKGEAQYIISTTHPDYHINQYQVPTPGGAADRLAEDVRQGCNKFAYTGLRIVASEPGVNEYEGYVSFEYLSRKRVTPGGTLTEAELLDTSAWNRTAERDRFLLTSSGVWQMADAQTATFDAGMLSSVQSAPQ